MPERLDQEQHHHHEVFDNQNLWPPELQPVVCTRNPRATAMDDQVPASSTVTDRMLSNAAGRAVLGEDGHHALEERSKRAALRMQELTFDTGHQAVAR
jgi:hypothetical protein